MGSALEVDGRLYRVVMVVKDSPKNGGLTSHDISAVQIYDIENPPVSKTDGGLSDIRAATAPAIRLAEKHVSPSDHVISLADFVSGRKPYERVDGKGFFDPVDETAYRDENGPYYERPDFFAQRKVIPIAREEWRPLSRAQENMTPEERAVFDEYVDGREDSQRIRDNLERLKGTPWAKQAIEAVFVRAAVHDLLSGRSPRVQSMLDNPQLAGLRADLALGERGLWSRLEKNGFVGNASKPAHNVNGSFLDCTPSDDCAKFCYATGGNYRYAATVVKSELISEAIRLDPVRAATITVRGYMATPEHAAGKALRLFDKGDGNLSWIPYIKELNRQGVRVQIFSKRPEFLRKVPEENLRLLSIDASNLDMAAKNRDLRVAFVYSDESQLPVLSKLGDQLQVVLPVKEGRSYMSPEKIGLLKEKAPAAWKKLCPIDAGWKKLKDAKHPDGWNCTMCDKNGGVGCFRGQTTATVMNAAARAESEAIRLQDMSALELAQLLQEKLSHEYGAVGEDQAAGPRTGGERGLLQGSVRRDGALHVSGAVVDELQGILGRFIAESVAQDGGRPGGQAAGVPGHVRGEQPVLGDGGPVDPAPGRRAGDAASAPRGAGRGEPEKVGGTDAGQVTAREQAMDRAYMAAVEAGDVEKARAMVAKRAEEAGFKDAIPEQAGGWKVRTRPAPKKTVKAYKVFFVDTKIGRPSTLFVGDAQALPVGVWLDAKEAYHITNPKNGRQYVPTFSNPNRVGADGKKKTKPTGDAVPIADEATKAELIKRGFIGPRANSVTAVAYRPGWHAGTLPYFPQGGLKREGSNYGMVHEQKQVVYEIEVAADKDYTEIARSQPKAITKAGKVNLRNADLDYLPKGGMYYYTTNPRLNPQEDGWVITDSIKVVRALSQEECDALLAKAGKLPQEWSQGKMVLSELGIKDPEASDAARKTLAPITYDEDGNVIPLSRRFDSGRNDVLYQMAYHGSPAQFDKFTLDHIGSGEGAQAHGWGLYFALDKVVADGYRDRISAMKGAEEGHVYTVDIPEDSAMLREEARMYDQPQAIQDAVRGLVPELPDIGRPTTSTVLAGSGASRAPLKDYFSGPAFANVPKKFAMIIKKSFGRPQFKSVGFGAVRLKDVDARIAAARDAILRAATPEDNLPVEHDMSFVDKYIAEAGSTTDVAALEALKERVLSDDRLSAYDNSAIPGAADGEALASRLRQIQYYNQAGPSPLMEALAALQAAEMDLQKVLYMKGVSADVSSKARLVGIVRNPSSTGKEAYEALTAYYGGWPKRASLALKEVGIKGIRYYGRRDGECAVVWDEHAIDILSYLQNMQDHGVIAGGYSPSSNSIHLTPNADITTFSHEMGHWWLANAIEASKRSDCDLQLRHDVQALLRTFGVQDAEAWDALGVDGQRERHEAFAAWVEEYLVTGRAPDDQTRGILERFRAWIVALYRDFRAHLDERYRGEFGKERPQLSDEVRDILDRNLSYMDELEAVQREFSPLNGQVDAARYAAFENTVRKDQPVDQSDPSAMGASIFAESEARAAMDEGRQVDVSAPVDRQHAQNRVGRLSEQTGIPDEAQTTEDLEKVAPDEGAPVHEIPEAQTEEADEGAGMDDMFGDAMQESLRPERHVETSEMDAIARRAEEILSAHPDLMITIEDSALGADGAAPLSARDFYDRVDAEATEQEKFADALGTAADCVLRNGGIKNA